MKANELRIGNWCNIVDSPFKNETGEHQIEAITIRYFECKDGLLVLEPIPLTEEWLVKFGFEDVKQYGNCDYQKLWHSGLFVCIDLPNYAVTIGQLNDFSHCIIELKYVHQLQNLYFALTEEELII